MGVNKRNLTILIVGILIFTGLRVYSGIIRKSQQKVVKSFLSELYNVEYVEGKSDKEYVEEIKGKIEPYLENSNNIDNKEIEALIVYLATSSKSSIKYSDCIYNKITRETVDDKRIWVHNVDVEFILTDYTTKKEKKEKSEGIYFQLDKVDSKWKISKMVIDTSLFLEVPDETYKEINL